MYTPIAAPFIFQSIKDHRTHDVLLFESAMKKVVFVINSLTGGGAERIMTRLLGNSTAEAQGAELHLILLDVEPAAYPVPPPSSSTSSTPKAR